MRPVGLARQAHRYLSSSRFLWIHKLCNDRYSCLLYTSYPVFLGFVAWLFMGYYLEPTHQGALVTLYIFINIIFFGIMLFTRKQIVTRIVAIISPFLAFAILLFGFGNWFAAVPPIVVSVLIFLLSGACLLYTSYPYKNALWALRPAKPLGVLSRHPCRSPKPLSPGKGLYYWGYRP